MNKSDTIKGGVIIIGSLIWENEHNAIPDKGSKKLGKYRREWREKNLDVSNIQIIPLPIRYGRCSSGRHHTYTMVLSREYLNNNQGAGLIVPFKKQFIQNKLQQVTTQLKYLSIAEGIITQEEKNRFAALWGGIAIWINPKSKFKIQIENYWQNVITKPKYKYREKSYAWADGTLLDDSFRLQLEINTDCDFLVCTYILPKYKKGDNDSDANQNMKQGYPNPKMLNEAIQKSKYSTYFCQNRVNNIVTVDDNEIFDNRNKNESNS